ncbi:MAG TPA: transcriptional regulator [Vicinamibacterales bacterium]|nr:transcriptional regulator [Vicinamibacterales bacterium]
MPRGSEVIRQWNIIRALDGARQGVTVQDLAEQAGVTVRTIWRDLAALQEAGFPLYDEKIDGRAHWRLNSTPFRQLADRGFTLTQLCALYFSRTLVECLAGTPFQQDLRGAFEELARALPPRMRAFFDRIPAVIDAKRGPVRVRAEALPPEIIARLLDATLHQRRIEMRYHSASSKRTKAYTVEPYRLVYADGGVYLLAFVPEYAALRTFAVERIEAIVTLEETFERRVDVDARPFDQSLGVNMGTPTRVELEFGPPSAGYVRERLWHASQSLQEQPDGSIRMTLDVCVDWALTSWILSFGPFVRVLAPAVLAADIRTALQKALALYEVESTGAIW